MARGFKRAGLSGLALRLMPCVEARNIPEAHHLIRRFRDDPNHLTWDDELGPVPHHSAGNSLQFDPDLSTSWREHLEEHGIGPAGVLGWRRSPYSLVGQISVWNARQLNFLVKHTPTETIPTGCAHASIDWPPGEIHPPATQPAKAVRSKLRSELARGFPIIYGTVDSLRPPGA